MLLQYISTVFIRVRCDHRFHMCAELEAGGIESSPNSHVKQSVLPVQHARDSHTSFDEASKTHMPSCECCCCCRRRSLTTRVCQICCLFGQAHSPKQMARLQASTCAMHGFLTRPIPEYIAPRTEIGTFETIPVVCGMHFSMDSKNNTSKQEQIVAFQNIFSFIQTYKSSKLTILSTYDVSHFKPRWVNNLSTFSPTNESTWVQFM